MKTYPKTTRPSTQRGFALVIVLSLMAFVLLLLVSLSSLVSINTSSDRQVLKEMQAQQNAILGAQLAVSKLQRSTGPDQRVTARAEILDTQPESLTADEINHPFWIGAWKTFDPDNPNSTLEGGLRDWSYNTEGADWLVSQPSSGNTDPRTTPQNDGVVLARDLVGNDGNLVTVRAPVVDFGNDSSQYAFWIADEGLKAKVTQLNPYSEVIPGRTLENQLNFLSPTRTAPELNDRVSEIFDDQSSTLGRVALYDDFLFLVREEGLDDSVFDTLKEYSQDYTTGSFGILANVKDGGLRKDLTRGLDDQFVANLGMRTSPGDNLLYEDTVNRVYGPNWDVLAAHYQMYRPRVPAVARVTNGQFGGYVNTSVSGPLGIQNPSSPVPSVEPRLSGVEKGIHHIYNDDSSYFRTAPALRGADRGIPVQKQIMPILLSVRLDIGLESYRFNAGDETNPEERGGLRLRFYPTVVLWNPYNVAISEQEYKVRWKTWINTGASVRFADAVTEDEIGELGIWLNGSLGGNGGQGIVWMKTEPIVLQPGEVRVFSVPAARIGQTVPDNWQLELVSGGTTSSDSYYVADLVDNQNGTKTQWKEPGEEWIQWDNDDLPPPWQGIELVPGEDPEVQFSYRVAGAMANLEKRFRSFAIWFSAPNLNAAPIKTSTGSEAIAYLAQNFTISIDEPKTLDLGLFEDLGSKISGSILKINGLDEARAPTFGQINLRRSQDREDGTGQPPLFYGSIYEVDAGISSNLDIVHTDGKGYWGETSGATGEQNIVAFDIPRLPLQSLGALMHAEGGYDDWAPNYVIGNSYASPFIPRNSRFAEPAFVDLSHYANEALFDGYFFSTVPAPNRNITRTAPFNEVFDQDYINSESPLPNPGMIPISPVGSTPLLSDLQDFDTAAENLRLEGAFNINSTSVPAWEAVLGSLRGQAMQVYSVESGATSQVNSTQMQNPFPRMATPLGTPTDTWTGFRTVTDSQINQLATAIVEEIKKRGPFLSLGDFVNRRLSSTEFGFKGALQAAIDSTTINNSLTNAQILDNSKFPNAENLVSGNGINQPIWLSQNDLLVALAPKISARSDTFIIRSYGSTNSGTGQGKTSAWCEVTVQRSPQFADSSANQPSDDPSNWSSINAELGRAYEIVDFRWIDDPSLN
ncbi:MAG: hypothetical protein AAGJ81_01340 [Verrucomicrobiota bacterium]